MSRLAARERPLGSSVSPAGARASATWALLWGLPLAAVSWPLVKVFFTLSPSWGKSTRT